LGGVVDVVVGYTGGRQKNPTYSNIMDSTEAFLVEFDPSVISYEAILDEWALQHAPFYPSKCQYRSAIFYTNEEQRDAANKKIQELGKNGSRKVYVDLEPVSSFYRAEEYHQDFLDKQTGARVPKF
jgi:peptide-methionine (S)-S-oxide reductase